MHDTGFSSALTWLWLFALNKSIALRKVINFRRKDRRLALNGLSGVADGCSVWDDKDLRNMIATTLCRVVRVTSRASRCQ